LRRRFGGLRVYRDELRLGTVEKDAILLEKEMGPLSLEWGRDVVEKHVIRKTERRLDTEANI
jgi:hypothetical protein